MEQNLAKLEKVRGRNPAPAKPDFFDAQLVGIGGTNPFGEPMLKVGWGWDLKVFRFGKEALKYPGPLLNRWILEKRLAPEFFGSKKHWEQHRYTKSPEGKQIDLLGDFPSRGQYGMVMPLTTVEGGYLPLGGEVIQFIQMVQHGFDNMPTLNAYSDAKRYAQLQKNMRLEEEAQMAEQDKIDQEHFDYTTAHEHDLNKEVKYSLPTLWTPDGERSIH